MIKYIVLVYKSFLYLSIVSKRLNERQVNFVLYYFPITPNIDHLPITFSAPAFYDPMC